ncbi:MAG: hypothetical protein EAZ91_19195 [Cytophagales bacterium]|nr:MAG: hypothetical protein EAZ91_19195 [Cytophagales bacterium]
MVIPKHEGTRSLMLRDDKTLAMNVHVLNLALGLVVSLLGTLPLGVLNLTALRLTVQQGVRAAVRFAVSCALMEFLYAYVAVWSAKWVSQSALLKPLTGWLTALVLFGLGVYYLRKPPATPTAPAMDSVGPFRLGVQLSLLNVAAFPFWTFYTTLLTQQGLVRLDNQPQLLLYVFGISVGTLLGLGVFVWGGHWLTGRFAHRLHQTDRLMGWLLIGLGLVQALSTLHPTLLAVGTARLPQLPILAFAEPIRERGRDHPAIQITEPTRR